MIAYPSANNHYAGVMEIPTEPLSTVEWSLNKLLKEMGKKPSDLEKEIQKLGYAWGDRYIYRFTSRTPSMVELGENGTLPKILHGLCILSDRLVTTDDIMPFGFPKTNSEEVGED